MPDWANIKTTAPKRFKNKSARAISDILTEIMTEDSEQPYVPEMRASKLPICGLLHALELLGPHKRTVSASMDFYTEIGNAVHETYQKKLLHSNKWGKYVYGDFSCEECEQVAYTNCRRPKNLICPNCKKGALKYKELQLRYKNVIGAHVDMILKFDDDTFWLLEFKTTSAWNVERPDRYLPSQKHKIQAESYSVMLKEQHGIDITQFFIVYISRDKTQRTKRDERHHVVFPFKNTKSRLDVRRAYLDRIVIDHKLISRLFDDPSRINLKRLDRNRPCKSKKDYYDEDSGMTHNWLEQEKGCPHLKSCRKNPKFTTPAKEIYKQLERKVG